MIQTFTFLLIFQCLGEGLAHVFGLPVPGPVLGMLLLFGFLVLRKDFAQRLAPTVQEFLKHLSLLFIPAGVGIMVLGQQVLAEWLPLAAALVVSTAVSITVTALVVRWLQK
ncbi:MAG: CidA/LrgA family protein [Pseudomonadota bacterium]